MPQTVGEYLGKTKPPVIHQHAVSDVYRKRAEEMWGDKLSRYCTECGRLPRWCECEERCVGTFHGFTDREGKYHPAPGCNVIVEGLL